MNDDQVLYVLACSYCKDGEARRDAAGYRCEDCGRTTEGEWLLSCNPDVPHSL